MLFTKRNARTKRLERFAALKIAKKPRKSRMYLDFGRYQWFLGFPICNIDIEPSDGHPMGAHRKSLQKPSQHTSVTSQTEGQHSGPLLHPLTMSTNIEDFAIFGYRTLQKPYVVEGER